MEMCKEWHTKLRQKWEGVYQKNSECVCVTVIGGKSIQILTKYQDLNIYE